MTKIIYKNLNGTSKTVEVNNGLSVMEGALQNNIPGIDADCGGSMAYTPHVMFTLMKNGLKKLVSLKMQNRTC